MYERPQHELHRLGRVAECLHACEQRVLVEPGNVVADGEVTQRDSILGQPFTVRPAAGKLLFELDVGYEPTLHEVDEEHPAGLEAAFMLDHCRIDR